MCTVYIYFNVLSVMLALTVNFWPFTGGSGVMVTLLIFRESPGLPRREIKLL